MKDTKKIEILLEDSIFFAKRILAELNGFHPFGQYLDKNDKSINVSYETDESVSAKVVVGDLKKSFFEKFKRNDINGFSVIYDIILKDSELYKGYDAVRVDIVVSVDYISSFFFPYKVLGNGIEYFKPFGVKSDNLQ